MIRVFDDAAALAQGAADLIIEGSWEPIEKRGAYALALAGGSTPERTYRELVTRPAAFDLSKTWFLFGDERCVPPDHERSNYRMAKAALLDPYGVEEKRVLRMEGELDPKTAASRYEERLRKDVLPATDGRLDLVLLGMGGDGHTASLFPGTAALDERQRAVVANHVPEMNEWRLTLTLPILNRARRIVFLVTGQDKAAIVAEAFGGAPHATPHPCERVCPEDGELRILLDRKAASKLGRG